MRQKLGGGRLASRSRRRGEPSIARRSAPSSGRTTQAVPDGIAAARLRYGASARLRAGFEFVAARDTVDGHRLAMDKGRRGHRYIFSTRFVSVDDLMAIFEDVTGRRRPRLRLPPPVMAGLAGLMNVFVARLAPDHEPRFTPGAVRLLRMNRRATSRRRGSSWATCRRRSRTAAWYSDGRRLSDTEITGLLLAIIFAGQHTSAVMATWTDVLLLEHPEWLPALLEEQSEVFDEGTPTRRG
jgi:hypothetical protein